MHGRGFALGAKMSQKQGGANIHFMIELCEPTNTVSVFREIRIPLAAIDFSRDEVVEAWVFVAAAVASWPHVLRCAGLAGAPNARYANCIVMVIVCVPRKTEALNDSCGCLTAVAAHECWCMGKFSQKEVKARLADSPAEIA